MIACSALGRRFMVLNWWLVLVISIYPWMWCATLPHQHWDCAHRCHICTRAAEACSEYSQQSVSEYSHGSSTPAYGQPGRFLAEGTHWLQADAEVII
jgi:hypothetical protein